MFKTHFLHFILKRSREFLLYTKKDMSGDLS